MFGKITDARKAQIEALARQIEEYSVELRRLVDYGNS
jgi:hypothetical protein